MKKSVAEPAIESEEKATKALSEPERIRRNLLEWYEKNRRSLPWRKRRDAYAILVAEVMLQQTQVSTVLRFYEGFLARFPDFGALAAAPTSEVLAAWSGLGYYQRARRLQALAHRVGDGGLPKTRSELLKLPGIGRYTAAAVASIAFGEAVPVVDGNVERVLARWLALEDDVDSGLGRSQLEEVAARFLSVECPGESNQALMELGATVCLPRNPRCERCPLRSGCQAHRQGRPSDYPRHRRQGRTQEVRWIVGWLEDGDRLLLTRRSEEADVLAGLWEFPTFEWPGGSFEVSQERTRKAIVGGMQRQFGGRWWWLGYRGQVRHAITTRRIKAEIIALRWRQPRCGEHTLGWYSRSEIDSLPTSSLVHKAIERGDRSPHRD